jgi:SAM-dependent methyltransferase
LRNIFKKADHRLKKFYQQLKMFKELDNQLPSGHCEMDITPYLNDATAETFFDAHYIYHPAWAARIIKNNEPELHIDISSTLHFCSILSAFVKTKFYDFRPAKLTLSGLDCLATDLTALPFATGSIESLSCMHTIEHIGLGRYGDPVDPRGDLKAITELKRVCRSGGTLLIVVPVGQRKIVFNAHRIYHPADIIGMMNGFVLKNFSLVDDRGNYIENASFDEAAEQGYGCGCFWFLKENGNR